MRCRKSLAEIFRNPPSSVASWKRMFSVILFNISSETIEAKVSPQRQTNGTFHVTKRRISLEISWKKKNLMPFSFKCHAVDCLLSRILFFFFLFSFEFYSAIKHLIPVVYLWPARARSSISAEKCIVPRARSHL